MSRKRQKDWLLADLASVNAMLKSTPDDDFAGKMSFESRKKQIEAELEELGEILDTLANVTILFHGKPVISNQSISASFASKALEAYQSIIASYPISSKKGKSASSAKLPALNIKAITRGSFGFVLEEDDKNSPPLFSSPLQESLEKISKILEEFTSENDNTFENTVQNIDNKMFSSIKKFFNILHKEEATVRIIEGERDNRFGSQAIKLAHDRCEKTELGAEEIKITGTLMGFLPLARDFELKKDDEEVIKGKIEKGLSEKFIKNGATYLDSPSKVTLLRETTEHPERDDTVKYTLLALSPLKKN